MARKIIGWIVLLCLLAGSVCGVVFSIKYINYKQAHLNYEEERQDLINKNKYLEELLKDYESYGKFAVTFYVKGSVYDVQLVEKNGYIDETELITPLFEGYVFDCWSLADGTRVDIVNLAITEDIALYGQMVKLLDYEIIDGVITNYTGTEEYINIPLTYSLLNGKAIAGSDYEVTTIGEYAFANKEFLQQVNVDSNIVKTEANAFLNCSNLFLNYWDDPVDLDLTGLETIRQLTIIPEFAVKWIDEMIERDINYVG